MSYKEHLTLSWTHVSFVGTYREVATVSGCWGIAEMMCGGSSRQIICEIWKRIIISRSPSAQKEFLAAVRKKMTTGLSQDVSLRSQIFPKLVWHSVPALNGRNTENRLREKVEGLTKTEVVWNSEKRGLAEVVRWSGTNLLGPDCDVLEVQRTFCLSGLCGTTKVYGAKKKVDD